MTKQEEISRTEFDGVRIYGVKGFPICDIGVVPGKPQPDGEVGDKQVKVKFNKAGEAQIE